MDRTSSRVRRALLFFSPPLSSNRLSASREFPSSRRSTSTGSTLSFLHGGHVSQLGARRIHRGHLGPHQRLRPRAPRGDFEARKGTLIFCIYDLQYRRVAWLCWWFVECDLDSGHGKVVIQRSRKMPDPGRLAMLDLSSRHHHDINSRWLPIVDFSRLDIRCQPNVRGVF